MCEPLLIAQAGTTVTGFRAGIRRVPRDLPFLSSGSDLYQWVSKKGETRNENDFHSVDHVYFYDEKGELEKFEVVEVNESTKKWGLMVRNRDFDLH